MTDHATLSAAYWIMEHCPDLSVLNTSADHAGTVGRWLIYERNTNPEPTHYTHAELREFARSKGWEENNEKL